MSMIVSAVEKFLGPGAGEHYLVADQICSPVSVMRPGAGGQEGMAVPETSPRVAVYITGVSLLGLAALIAAASVTPAINGQVVLVLSGLCILGTQAKVRRLVDHADLSFNSIVQLAALTLTGPLGAILVGIVPWVVVRKVDVLSRVFNA